MVSVPRFITLAAAAATVPCLRAQDLFQTFRPQAPSGFQSLPNTPSERRGMDWEDEAKEVLDPLEFGISSSLYYDSNISLAGAAPGGASGGDMVLAISPTISYRTPGRRWWLGFDGGMNYETFFDHSDLSNLSYAAVASGGFQGAKLSVEGRIGYSLSEGANRYAGGRVEEGTLALALAAKYTLSPKTSISSTFTHSVSDGSGALASDTTNTSFALGAMWKATPLIQLGPELLWTYSDGTRQVDRDAFRPAINIDYRLGRKIHLSSSLGVEFADYGNSGTDTSFAGSFAIRYRGSAFWSTELGFYQGTTPDSFTPGSYRESTAIRLAYQHRLGRGRLDLGLGWENSDLKAQGGGGVPGVNASQEYLAFQASYSRPIFADRAEGAVFYEWSDQSGFRSYDRHVVGLRVTARF